MKKLLLAIFTLLLTTSLSAQTIHLDINYPITFEKMCETLNLSLHAKKDSLKKLFQSTAYR